VANADSNLFAGEKGFLTPLQERFLKEGPEGLKYREIIELLVSSPDLAPADCNRLVRKVMRRYKTLRELVAASDEELGQIGVTPRGLLHIKFVREVAKEVLKEGFVNQAVYTSPHDIFEYLAYSMRDLKNEVLKAIYLNSRGQITDVEDVITGEAEYIAINFRHIQQRAIERGAHRLIFVHNHTSGDPTPSPTDRQLTRDLVFMGIILQIKVLDHIIIGENSYFSFAGEGLIQEYEDSFLNLRIKSAVTVMGRDFGKVFAPYARVS
jgi:DNA repair protein RadC